MNIELDTKWLIEKFEEKYDLTIGGIILNSENLLIIKHSSQFDKIPNKYGCYFIFSNLQKKEVFTFNDYKCFDRAIVKMKTEFRCLYNGKAKNIRSRIKNHLNNSRSKNKILIGDVNKIPQTGCLSLESIKKSDIEKLLEEGKLKIKPNYSYLKHSKKLSRLNEKNIDPNSYLLNGINIFEDKWNENSFGIIVLTTKSKLGAGIIEQSFRNVNGIPPLCKM